MEQLIIGVDCATKPANVGLALACSKNNNWILSEAFACKGQNPATIVSNWVHDSSGLILLALDAPLGWPSSLGYHLQGHHAGALLPGEANMLFRRATERFVYEQLGQTALAVGADKIARTAHWALCFLDEVRSTSGLPIPLAWTTGWAHGTQAIEVYPAATLRAHGARSTSYKEPDQTQARQSIVAKLETHMEIGACADILENNHDALDAAVCVLAGIDFLSGAACEPTDLDVAKKEGWIWLRQPSLFPG